MAAVARGFTAAHETWESGRHSGVGDGRTLEYVVTGPFEALRGMLPQGRKPRFEGRRVTGAALAPKRGGMGRLSVTVSLGGSSSASAPGGAAGGDSTLEIEMAQQELDVRTLLGGSEGYCCSLAAWEQAPAELKQRFMFVNPNGGEERLGGQALSVARLILAGIESVLRFHPVVTLTTYYDDEPSSKPVRGLGAVGGEPAASPGGYEYLKTGDRWTESRDGSWMRVEQWTGAKKWNGSLYRGGTGNPADASLLEALP